MSLHPASMRHRPTSMRHGRLGGGGRLASAIVLAMLIGACREAAPRDTAQVSDLYYFDDVSIMVATSGAVLIGTVQEVVSGEEAGPPGEEIRHTNATVGVEEVLWGSVQDPTITIETLDIPVFEPEWRRPGTRVLLFLRATGEPDAKVDYVLTNYSQSAYVLEGEGLIATGQDDGLALSLAGNSLEDVRLQVADAVSKIEVGEVQPQEPPVTPIETE